jgi:hypothetical protein
LQPVKKKEQAAINTKISFGVRFDELSRKFATGSFLSMSLLGNRNLGDQGARLWPVEQL